MVRTGQAGGCEQGGSESLDQVRSPGAKQSVKDGSDLNGGWLGPRRPCWFGRTGPDSQTSGILIIIAKTRTGTRPERVGRAAAGRAEDGGRMGSGSDRWRRKGEGWWMDGDL